MNYKCAGLKIQRLFYLRRFFLAASLASGAKSAWLSGCFIVAVLYSSASFAESDFTDKSQLKITEAAPIAAETSSKQAANQQEILINKNIQIKEAPPELAVTNTSLTDVFSPSNSKFANKPETSLISVVELLGSLLVVVALILLLAWILKRMGMAGPSNGTLKVLSNLPLGQKQQLLVVQAGEHQLLLGVSSGSINLLKEFEKPIVDAQLSTSNQITSNIFSGKIPNKFSNHLARALGKKND